VENDCLKMLIKMWLVSLYVYTVYSMSMKENGTYRVAKKLHNQYIVLKPANKSTFWVKFDYKRSARILVGINYSMHNVMCDVVGYCALRCDMGF